ncbi:cysteine-rich receptor-like protein kinase 26 [Tanacetum coccineum]
MLILTGKPPFVFLFIFLYLLNTITLAQHDFNSYDCVNAAGNYTRNSPYQRNLDTTLSALPSTNSGFGFFNSSTGQGSDTVHSAALCRGDVNLDACRTCLNDSVVKLREICPNKKQAIGYYDLCMLKYSNQTVLGNTAIRYYVFLMNTQNASDVDRFNGALSPLLNNLTAEASAGGSLRKFATGNTRGPGVTSIYALVQCTPDLTQQQCNECLGGGISVFSNQYSGRIGGRTLLPMCNFRYETYQFFNESTLAIPPPPSRSPRPPPPPPNSPSSVKLDFSVRCLPIGSNMKSIASWKTLVDRFHMRLSSWKANLLSIGGRLTLIKSVLGSLGIYYLSILRAVTPPKIRTMQRNGNIGVLLHSTKYKSQKTTSKGTFKEMNVTKRTHPYMEAIVGYYF